MMSVGEQTRPVQPVVSVVIPAYDCADTISATLASAAGQTLSDIEIIVVDDGSRDATATVVAEQAAADSRIQLIRHGENRGAAAARNTGIKAARGTYVALLDADDAWRADKLARQVERLEAANGRVDAVVSGYVLHRVGTGTRRTRLQSQDAASFGRLLDVCDLSAGSTLIVRRTCFREVGLFDESLRRFEDWEWLMRFSEGHEFGVAEEALAEINMSATPAPDLVAAAGRRLYGLQAARIAKRGGPAAERRFRASLAIEEAVASVRHRRYLRAGMALALALWSSPARVMTLAARLWRKAVQRDY